jgi:DNA-binding transcriptional LysR family regulator
VEPADNIAARLLADGRPRRSGNLAGGGRPGLPGSALNSIGLERSVPIRWGNLDFRRLRYFVAVAETTHFGRAAEQMNVVQSAVSQQIKLLEDELGVKLLERSRPNVKLTESGRQFLPACRRVLMQAEEAVRVARQAECGHLGRIRCSFVDNALWSLLPPLVRAYRDRYPAVEVELHPMDRDAQIKALEDRATDVALIPVPEPVGDFQSDLFAEAPLVVGLPNGHPLCVHRAVPIAMLAECPLVAFPAGMGARLSEIVVSACFTAGFAPRVAQEAAQMHTQLALVAAGFGICFVPGWVAATDFQNVQFRPVIRPSLPYGLRFVCRRDNDNAALRNFMALVREFAAASRR